MMTRLLILLTLVLTAAASSAEAQPRVEIGTSLVSSAIGVGDSDGSTLAVPGGHRESRVYASFFVGPHVAVEPQVSFSWTSLGVVSGHVIDVAGQVDYFVLGAGRGSPFVFASAGASHLSGGFVPKSFAVGAGYRVPLGRLTFRADGQYRHRTGARAAGPEDPLDFLSPVELPPSDQVVFTLSIGGLFGGGVK